MLLAPTPGVKMTIYTDKRTVSVVLTEEIIEKLDELVERGDYESRSEAVRSLLDNHL